MYSNRNPSNQLPSFCPVEFQTLWPPLWRGWKTHLQLHNAKAMSSHTFPKHPYLTYWYNSKMQIILQRWSCNINLSNNAKQPWYTTRPGRIWKSYVTAGMPFSFTTEFVACSGPTKLYDGSNCAHTLNGWVKLEKRASKKVRTCL